MPFKTFVHYVHSPHHNPPPPPPPPPKKKKGKKKKEKFFFRFGFFVNLWILCQFVKKFINTESSWQIIQIRKNGWGGGGGEVCVVWASGGGVSGKCIFFDIEIHFFVGGGVFLYFPIN